MLTKNDAIIIKEWRAKGATWRRIAEYAAEKWPERNYHSGNQLEGRELCQEASELLGENYREEPWD